MTKDSVFHLAVVSDIDDLASNNDLSSFEQEVRDRAVNLGKQIEVTYWELGKALSEVWSGIPGGWKGATDPTRSSEKPLFAKWGYSTFEEYCEKEVGMRRRTASNLRYAYWWFEHQMTLPTEIKDRLKKLGRSKLYALAGFVTMDNVVSWIDKAESMTAEQIKKATMTAKAVSAKDHTDPVSSGGKDLPAYSDSDAMFEYADSVADSGESESRPRASRSEMPEAPAPETTHTLHTSLYDGQWKTWQDAFERSKEITGSDKISHNLEMICLDYLSTNQFLKPADSIGIYFSKLERLLGMKLIAIDPQSGKPKYGADLLWLMVQARTEASLDAKPNGEASVDPALTEALKLADCESVDSDIPKF